MKIHKVLFYIYIIIVYLSLFASVCSHGYPDLSEYELVSSITMRELEHGCVFLNNDLLTVVYRNQGDDYYLMRIEEYDIKDPGQPNLLYAGSLTPHITHDMVVVSDIKQAFFYRPAWKNLYCFDFETTEIIEIETDFLVSALAIQDTILYLKSSDGLVILDINDPNNPLELYNENDTTYYYDHSTVAVADTVLFEHMRYLARFRWWNIKNPQAPGVFAEGYYYTESPVQSAVTDDYLLITHYKYWDIISLYRCARDYADTLTIEETGELNSYSNNLTVIDTMVYLLNYSEITIFTLDDFSQHLHIRPIALANPSYLSFKIQDQRIYVLCRGYGIFIYERSAL